MRLRTKQIAFARAVSKLIEQAFEQGYEVVLGEAWRHPETAKYLASVGKGIENSLHCKCLAIDISLFKDGEYLTRTESYRELGEWWEAYGLEQNLPLCWGGRFDDGNHFSLSHGGVK